MQQKFLKKTGNIKIMLTLNKKDFKGGQKLDYETKKAFIINTVFIAIIVGLCYLMGKFMLNFLLPFLIALALCFLVNKLSNLLKSKLKIGHEKLRIAILVCFYLLLALLAASVMWGILSFSGGALREFKNYIESEDNIFYKLTDKIYGLAQTLPENLKNSVTVALEDFSQKIISYLAGFLPNAAMATMGFLPRFLISFAATVVASFYISRDYKRLVIFLKNMLGGKRFSVLIEIKDILTGSVLRLFGGYLILSLITFCQVWLSLLILSAKHPLFLATVTAAVDLLPVLGSGTVLVPYAVISFINGNNRLAIGIIVIYITVLIVRNFLEPKIIGERLNINPLLMLITVFVGLRIGGVAGMFLLPVSTVTVITYYKRQLDREKGA